MSVIGIDIGTTSICALLMEPSGVTGLKKRNHDFLDDSVYSQNPEETVSMVLELVDSLWNDQVTDIAISSQMHGILFTDEAGRAVTDFYTWKNPWGNAPCGSGTLADFLTEKIGTATRSGHGICTAYHLNQIGGIPCEAACLCNIGDYAAMRLTGEKRPVMNVTIAESIGCFSQLDGDFDRRKLAQLGLRESLFPRVSVKDVVCGTCHGARVHAAFGDNQCSFLGSVEDYRRDVCINVGTGQQVSCFSPVREEAGSTEVRSFFDLGYLYVGVSQNGGKVYERLIRMIESMISLYTGTQVDGYVKTWELWQSRKRSRKLPTVTPALYGAIDGQPAGTVLLEELSEEQDGLDLIGGYVAGMAGELVRLYEQIPPSVRKNKTRFFGSGNGIVRNRILWELTAEKLHAKIERECREEAAAAGAVRYILMEET